MKKIFVPLAISLLVPMLTFASENKFTDIFNSAPVKAFVENLNGLAESQNISINCDGKTPYSINIDDSGLFKVKISCAGQKAGKELKDKALITVEGIILPGEDGKKEIIYTNLLKADLLKVN